MATKTSGKEKSRWGQEIVVQAVWESFVKLNPRTLAKNPVMFVVEVGAVLTSIDLVRGVVAAHARIRILTADHAVAVVHGAVCEFRGSDGGRARQSAGGGAAQVTRGNGGAAIESGWQHRIGAEIAIARGRCGDGCRWRIHSRRRRSDRGRRVRGRIGDYGRIGAGDSRIGRRPVGGDGRDAGAFR